MATRVTEVRLVFRRPPRIRFIGGMNHGEPNQIVLRIDPDSGLRIGLTSQGSKRGWRQVHLDMTFEDELGPQLEPYERLLRDAIAGRNLRVGGYEEGFFIGPTLFGQALSNTGFYAVTVIVTAVWMLVFRNMIVSPFGSSLRVLGESSTLAESLGCSAFRLKVSAYVLGALPAGVAGSLFAYLTGFVSPDSFTVDVLIAVLAATVVLTVLSWLSVWLI